VKRDGTTLVGRLVSWKRTEVVFRAASGETHRLVPDEIARMSLGSESINTTTAALPEPAPPPPPQEPKPPEKIWKGAVDAGYAANRGTNKSDNLILAFEGERKTVRHRLKLSSRYFYTIKDGSLAGNELLAGARLDRFLSPRSFVFGSGDFEFDEVEKIDLRSIYAVGFGHDVRSSEAMRLSISGGAGYTRESYSDGTRKQYASGLFAQEFQKQVFRTSIVEQKFRYLQDLQETDRFKLRLDLGLRLKLNQFLCFRAGLANAFDNRPLAKVKKNDLTFTTGLGFTF
jgi:putative salt-induced outer membrane protein YdiY